MTVINYHRFHIQHDSIFDLELVTILGIPIRTCKLIIDNVIVETVNDSWAASDTGRMVRKNLAKAE